MLFDLEVDLNIEKERRKYTCLALLELVVAVLKEWVRSCCKRESLGTRQVTCAPLPASPSFDPRLERGESACLAVNYYFPWTPAFDQERLGDIEPVHLITKVETHHGNVEPRDFVAVKIRNFENVARALAKVLKGTGNFLYLE